jgi:hypothetical protein
MTAFDLEALTNSKWHGKTLTKQNSRKKAQRTQKVTANGHESTQMKTNRRWTQIYADVVLGSGYAAGRQEIAYRYLCLVLLTNNANLKEISA